ncbi:MAG: DUF4469 domain-containing protein [Treponema sp.]|nr:DUF4469 domain-containing protein [Treponema sp.]
MRIGAEITRSDTAVNRPAELIAVIPAPAPGAYRLRITTQYSGSNRSNTRAFDNFASWVTSAASRIIAVAATIESGVLQRDAR